MTNQPTVAAVGVVGVKPQNYLVLSIASIFCFCWLFGLIALLYSLQVGGGAVGRGCGLIAQQAGTGQWVGCVVS